MCVVICIGSTKRTSTTTYCITYLVVPKSNPQSPPPLYSYHLSIVISVIRRLQLPLILHRLHLRTNPFPRLLSAQPSSQQQIVLRVHMAHMRLHRQTRPPRWIKCRRPPHISRVLRERAREHHVHVDSGHGEVPFRKLESGLLEVGGILAFDRFSTSGGGGGGGGEDSRVDELLDVEPNAGAGFGILSKI